MPCPLSLESLVVLAEPFLTGRQCDLAVREHSLTRVMALFEGRLARGDGLLPLLQERTRARDLVDRGMGGLLAIDDRLPAARSGRLALPHGVLACRNSCILLLPARIQCRPLALQLALTLRDCRELLREMRCRLCALLACRLELERA